MLSKLKATLSRNVTNALGWHTNRKIVVFESDDWGSIRMPSKKSVETLRNKSFKVDKCAYMQNDSLESNEDLEVLFDFLNKRKKKPVITANFLTANPDFDKIKESKFRTYHYERVEKTLNDYPARNNVKKLWSEGLDNKIFIPQLHGREHLNIDNWMFDLQDGNKETIDAFDLNIFGVSANVVHKPRKSYQAAFGLSHGEYRYNYEEIIKDAAGQFKDLFGYDSKTFIAPNYTWGEEIEDVLLELGVTHFQGSRAQIVPNYLKATISIKRNYLGKKNKNNQKYLVRNVVFEPFSNQNLDWVGESLKEIENSFFWKKPAIISMHRVNFIGSINSKNRKRNLALFKELLDKIDKKWPEVEYLSSNELSKEI
jgi:predicted deacetylase